MKLKRIFCSLLLLMLLLSTSVIPPVLPGTVAQAATTVKLNTNNIFLSDFNNSGFYGYRLRVLNTKSNVSWKSSNTKVATIDKKGWVVGVSEGSTTVTATVGKTTLTCKVHVIPYGLYLSATSITLFEGDTYPLGLMSSVNEAMWTTTDKKVVTVKKDQNNQSTLTAKGVGTATVKVLVNKKYTLSCKVTVKKKEKIKIDQVYTISGQNTLVKSTNLSPVDALVVVKVLFYKTEEDYENGNVDFVENDERVIQAGQTIASKFPKPDILGNNNIEDVYERYTVTYILLPINDFLFSVEHRTGGLNISDIKNKIVGTTTNEIEVYPYSDVIDEVCAVSLAAVYYKDGKMVDIEEAYYQIIQPTRKETVKIQTAQYDFYDRLEYDDVEIFVNKISIPNK
ncbi:MAG: Ig domain protein group 2 domain protein [Firmicutes bacterium]|nr:Ig domain protein group 2 domain protein [Bacillota bacterium]